MIFWVTNNINSEKMTELVPSNFLLSQNFPNPFKENTRIKYCLPVKIQVKLTVFSDDGECVKELVNKIQEPGTYESKFDSSDIPDGFYHYQLQAFELESGPTGDHKSPGQVFIETKRMQLFR